MFLGKREIEVDTKQIKLVPFCKDCDSQDIETIQTCRKCGSHNIGHGSVYGDDERGIKKVVEIREEPYYKCDYCGKEFSGVRTPTMIAYDSGEFYLSSQDSSAECVYSLKGDICRECLGKVSSELNKELLKMIHLDNIIKISQKVLDDIKQK